MKKLDKVKTIYTEEHNMISESLFKINDHWSLGVLDNLCEEIKEKSDFRLTAKTVLVAHNNEVTTFSVMVNVVESHGFVQPLELFKLNIRGELITIEKKQSGAVGIIKDDGFIVVPTKYALVAEIDKIMRSPAIVFGLRSLYSAA